MSRAERKSRRVSSGRSGPETLDVLWAVLAAMRQPAGYAELLSRICAALAQALPCDRATIYVLSRRRGAFLPAADHGTPAEVVQAFVEHGFQPGAFPLEAELRAGRVVNVVRRTAPPALADVLRLAQLEGLAVVPLAFGGGAEGALACGVNRTPGFGREQVAMLERLAPHIAVLIQNVRLQSETARLAERRTRLASWAAEVLGAADLAEMTSRLSHASRSLFRASHAALLQLEGDVLVGSSERGEWRVSVDTVSVATEALRGGRVVVVNRLAESPYADGPFARRLGSAAMLAAPLVDGEGALGVLSVCDERPDRFRPTDEEDARLLAAIVTVALRKLLLVGELTHASAAKSEFLANVSHDLRTPLNVILGYTQLFAEGTFGPLAAEQEDAIGRILRTATAQVGLIDDLLDLARIEQGKLACRVRSVAVAEIIPSLRETMDVLLRDRPVRFEVAVAPDAVASTDAERLRQVLVNLLANAAKFTREGCVRLLAEREADAVRVSVVDTGPGMDPALAGRAHEPFVRGADDGAGSGLGLAIVARLLQRLGGELRIESAPGRGTGVHVRLPAAPA